MESSDSSSRSMRAVGRPSRGLRTWYGALDLVTAAVLVLLIRVLWMGSPFWPVTMGLWAGLLVLSAAGLFAGTRAGRFAARVASVYQLGFLVVLVFGILASVAHLWGLYGEIGTGISILLLVILALLFEVMALLPIFKLRALGLFERPPEKGRQIGVIAGVVAFIGLVLYCTTVYARASHDPRESISDAAREAFSRHLMALVQRKPPPPLPDDVGTSEDRWVMRILRNGRLEARVEASGTLEEAATAVVTTLDQTPPSLSRGRRAIVVDRVIAESDIDEGVPLLAALSIVPGLDGASGVVDGHRHTITPHELVLEGVLGAETPIRFIPEFEIGVRLDDVRALLCARAGQSADCDVTGLRRARTESWVLHDGRGTVELYRGRPTCDAPPTAEDALAGAREAGAYVRRSQRSDGRFRYTYDPHTGRSKMSPYNVPRHAGTSWFLLHLYEATDDSAHLVAAQKALDWLERRLEDCGKDLQCIGDGGQTSLGWQALPLIAFADHARLTGTDRYHGSIRALSEVLRRLQRDNGDFHFFLDRTTGQPIEGKRRLYAAGQAALALAMSGQALGDSTQLEAARKALDFMAGPYWDFFLSDLFFIEEHWTCMAADELHRLYGDEAHAELCLDAAAFDRTLQHETGEVGFPDYVGGIGFSPFFPPYPGATAARAEGMLAAHRISERQGNPDPHLREGIVDAIAFLLCQQYDGDDVHWFASPNQPLGAVPWNHYDPLIRIDSVQHAGEVMLHGARLLSPLTPQ